MRTGKLMAALMIGMVLTSVRPSSCPGKEFCGKGCGV